MNLPEVKVAVGLERSSLAALETLLAEVAFCVSDLRTALATYRAATAPKGTGNPGHSS